MGRSIAVRPRVVWLTTAMVLGALALGTLGLKASGLTNAESFRGHPQSVAGQQVLDRSFPAGAGEPVVVAGNPAAAPRLRAAFAATPGIADVGPAVGCRRPRRAAGDSHRRPGQPGRLHHDRPGPGVRARRARR